MKYVAILLTFTFALLTGTFVSAANERHETGLTMMADANAANNMALARTFAKLEKRFDKGKESGEIDKTEKAEIKELRKKIREKLSQLRVQGWNTALASKIQKKLNRLAKLIKKARKKTEVAQPGTGTGTPVAATPAAPGTDGVTPTEGAIETPAELTAENSNLVGEITEDELDAQLSKVVNGGSPDPADLDREDQVIATPARMPAVAAGIK